ncbi:hypothetical protein JW960_01970 [candidate division KSB1 bacterium]|nr:hypothetical protein [candidate division KSB1 bacterium]
MKRLAIGILIIWMISANVAECRAEARLQRIRLGVHDRYVRLVFDFDRPVPYNLDNRSDNNQLYVELANCTAPAIGDGYQSVSRNPVVNSMFVKRMNANKLLVRLECNSGFSYVVDELENPWRLVIDIIGRSSQPPEKKPVNPYHRGLELLKQQNPDAAIRQFELAETNKSYRSLANYQLGLIYSNQGELIKALDYFETVDSGSSVAKDARQQISRIQANILKEAEQELKQNSPPVPAKMKNESIKAPESVEPGDNLVPEKSRSPENATSEPHSITKIFFMALIMNIIIFVIYITASRGYRKKRAERKFKTKYKNVTATTRRPSSVTKNTPVFNALIRDEMQKQPEKITRVRDAMPEIEKPALPVQEIIMPSMPEPKTEFISEPEPEVVQFEITEQPVKKAEQVFYRNILRSTMEKTDYSEPVSKVPLEELMDQIEQLLAYNFDVKTIAKELNLGQDEIRMMINLRKTRKQAETKTVEARNKTNRITFA